MNCVILELALLAKGRVRTHGFVAYMIVRIDGISLPWMQYEQARINT